MAIYHVVIDDCPASQQVIEKLKERYPDRYAYHEQERLVFIRTDDISEEISMQIGFKGENKIEGASGAVFKMNANYAGYTNGGIWEWLTKYDN